MEDMRKKAARTDEAQGLDTIIDVSVHMNQNYSLVEDAG